MKTVKVDEAVYRKLIVLAELAVEHRQAADMPTKGDVAIINKAKKAVK